MHGAEILLQARQELRLGSALEGLGKEMTPGLEDGDREIGGYLAQMHGPQVVGAPMPRRWGGHIRQDHIRFAAERLHEPCRSRVVQEIHLEQDGARDRIYFQIVYAHD